MGLFHKKESNEEIIRRCYWKFLEREPDEIGFNHFLNLMKKNEIDEKKLIEILRKSKEHKRVKLAKPLDAKKSYIFKGTYDILYFIHPNSVADDIVVKNGIYDKWITSKLADLIPTTATIFDIGAHAGLLSLPFAKHYVPNGWVYSFEPDHKIVDQLKKNIKINKLQNIVVEPIALQNDPLKNKIILNRRRAIHDNGLRNDGISSIEKYPTYAVNQEIVNSTTIDNYVKDHDISNLELLKLDVEGAEFKILCGGEQTINRFFPIVIYEYDVIIDKLINYTNTRNCFEFLEKKGYKQYRIVNEEYLAELKKYDAELPASNIVCFHESTTLSFQK